MFKKILPLLLIAAGIILVFAPTLTYPFLESWDDPDHVTANPFLAWSLQNFCHWWKTPMAGIYMPFTMFTYMIDYAIGGLNPLVYRLDSLLCHLVAGLAFYGCGRRMGLRPGPALTGAMLFVIHPQRVESVVWLSERKDVLCAAMYLTSLYLYIRKMDEERFNWQAWSVYLLALLAKPMAVSLPFVIICLEFYRRRDFAWKYYLKVLLPWLAPAILIMLVTTQLQVISKSRSIDLPHQFSVLLYNIGWYVRMTLFPYGLNPIYPKVSWTMEAVIVTVMFYATTLAATAWSWYHCRQRLLFRIVPLTLAFGLALGPVVGMIHAGYIDYADRYSYIPSAFIWFGAAWLWQLAVKRPTSEKYLDIFLRILPIVYGGFLIWYSWQYSLYWRSYPDLIALSAQYEYPNSISLAEQGLFELKTKNYLGLFTVAERFDRNIWPGISHDDLRGQKTYAAFFRGEAYMNMGQPALAEKHYLEALKTSGPDSFYKPGFYLYMQIDMYIIHMSRHDVAGAMPYLDRIIELSRIRNKDFNFYFYSGMKAMLEKRYVEAEKLFNQAQQLKPEDQPTSNNLNMLKSIRQNRRRTQIQTTTGHDHNPVLNRL